MGDIVNPTHPVMDPPKPEPKPYIVPVMGDAAKFARFKPPVRHVVESDLAWIADMIVPKLREKKYPRLNSDFLSNWLRTMMYANFAYFVRTDHAVGVAVASHDLFEPMSEVNEKFVLGHRKGDMFEIYLAMKKWAISINACRLIVGQCSDANMPVVAERLLCDREEVLSIMTLHKK